MKNRVDSITQAVTYPLPFLHNNSSILWKPIKSAQSNQIHENISGRLPRTAVSASLPSLFRRPHIPTEEHSYHTAAHRSAPFRSLRPHTKKGCSEKHPSVIRAVSSTLSPRAGHSPQRYRPRLHRCARPFLRNPKRCCSPSSSLRVQPHPDRSSPCRLPSRGCP